MARWQRSVLAMLRRWTDLGFGRGLSMPDVVLPVVVLGDDRTDVERVAYAASWEVTSAAGNVPSGTLSAQDRDVELLAVLVSRPSNQLDANLYFDSAPPFAGSNSPLSSTTGVPPTANVLAISGAQQITGVVGVEAPLGTSVQLPLRGVVLPRGRRLVIEGATPNSTLRGVFCWRELDNR